MNKSILLTLLLSFLLCTCISTPFNQRILQTTTYVTTLDRGPTVENHCTNSLNRQQLYDSYGLTGDIPHGDSVETAFQFNTSVIDLAVNGKWSQFGDQMRAAGGKFFAFLGAWIIGLGVTLLLWPFLLCCCICPWSCPPCNKRRQNMPYTKCQMIWPAIFTLLLLLTIIVTSIVGIASRFKAQKNYDEVACASGVLLDDVINGNVSFTDSQKYFTGVRTIDTQLREMNSKITTLNTEIAKLGSTAPGVVDTKAKIITSKTSTGQIPSTTQASVSLTYNTPLQSTPGSTTSVIPSIFPTVLGNRSATDTLVGLAYGTLTIYQTILTAVSSAADTYTSNSASYTTSINQALNQTNRYATDLQQQDSKVNDFWNKNDKVFKGITTGEYIFYGILIGLTVLMFFAVGCTVWGMSEKCRYFMYTICVVMFFFCLIAFLFCIFVSIVNPMLYYTCQYVQENLNSKVKLQNTLETKLNIDSQIAGNISDCIAVDGTGDLAKNVLGDAVYTTISSLNSTYINLINIDTSLIDFVNLTHTAVLTNVTAFKKAQANDITDQTSLDQLIKLSKATNYACTSSGFGSDSWIPANNQFTSYVPCQIIGGSNADSSTCTSSANFNSRATGCTGCMDTFDLFKGNLTYTNVNLALGTRYPDVSCSTFNSQLSNVWGNFYKQKLDVIGPVQTRAQAAKTNSDAVVSTATYFNQVKEDIKTNFSSIVDSQYGLLQGLNCQVTGQDIRLMKNVVCQGLFLYTYFTRIVFGILSFALLFLMCCVTCTGHRNAKQMEFDPDMKPDQKKQPNSPTFQQNNMPSEQQFMYNRTNNTYQNPYPNPNPYPNQSPYPNPNPYQPSNQVNPYAPPNQYNQYSNYP